MKQKAKMEAEFLQPAVALEIVMKKMHLYGYPCQQKMQTMMEQLKLQI